MFSVTVLVLKMPLVLAELHVQEMHLLAKRFAVMHLGAVYIKKYYVTHDDVISDRVTTSSVI